MNSLSKREKRLLTLLVVLIICVLYYIYIAEPLVEKLKSANAKLDSSRAILVSLKESENNIGKIREEADLLAKEAEKAALSIPGEAKVPEIVVFLDEITNLSGCSAKKLTFGQSSSIKDGSQNMAEAEHDKSQIEEESLMIQPLIYEITGDLEGIMSLLDRIEKSDRKILVDKVSIVKDMENNNLSANLSMSCYYLKQEGITIENNYPFSNIGYGKNNIFIEGM